MSGGWGVDISCNLKVSEEILKMQCDFMRLGAVACCLIGHAAAQQSAASADELVVTATRQPTGLADEPISIGVLTAAARRDLMADRPAELINQVPGAMVQAGSGQEHLTAIRSPVLTGGAGAGSFLYLQDGVPLRSAGFANVNGLFDAQTPIARQIEVVRGPGDVAYGANAVHGSINVLSPDPLTAQPLRMTASAGSFDRYSSLVEGGGGGFYGALFAFSDGGYRADSGLFQFKAQGAHGFERGAVTGRTRLSWHHLEQETAGFVVGTDAFRDDALRRSNPNPDAFRDLDHLLLSSEITVDGPTWTTTVTPYALWTEMAFKLHFLPSQALEETSQAAVGMLTTTSRDLGARGQLQLGLDVDAARGTLREEQFIPDVFSFTQGIHYDYAVDAFAAAPFARLRWDLTDRTTVQGGLRLTHTAYDYDNQTDDGTVGRFLRPADRDDSFTTLTGKVALQRDFGGWGRGYVSAARGGRPPQTTDLYRLQVRQTEQAPDPETLDLVEAGWRWRTSAVNVDLAAYAGRKENFLFRDADGFTVNDGETIHRGLEADVRWRLSDQFALQGAGTYAIHEYDFTRVVQRESEVIVSGNAVDTAPETIGQLQAVWTPTPQWRHALQWTHVGEYFTDAANTNDYPGHDIVDLRTVWSATDQIEIGAAVTNIFDDRFARRADFAFGNERYFPGEERAVRVEVRLTP